MALLHPDTLRGDAGATAGCRDGMKGVGGGGLNGKVGANLPSFEVIIH